MLRLLIGRNVGFLRYYEVKQIPNFLMAAPMIILSASGIVFYSLYDPRRILSLGKSSMTGTVFHMFVHYLLPD